MTPIHCFTSATFSYLDRARILCETLKQHHPDWTLTLCLSDEEPPGFEFDLSREPFDRLVRIQELEIPNLREWMFEHDIVELCTAVKGKMLCRLLDEGAAKVVYLDPDIAVFGDLGEIGALLDQFNVVLTPHQVEPDQQPAAIIDNEIGSLKFGIYNLGFIAVAGTPEGKRFAQWWCDRLMQFCFDDVPNGLFTDQRWCDHVPAMFDCVYVLRNPGYNVASWNLSRRPITINSDGSVCAAGAPLRFYHFTKITWIGEVMLERYANDRVEVFELMHWYKGRLKANAATNLPDRWWAYGTYTSGKPIQREQRRAYRDKPELRKNIPNPYEAEPSLFQ